MDWLSCRKSKNLVKEVTIDKNLIESLIKSSSKKDYSAKLLVLDQNTASSKVSLAYDSARELMEALALLKGYKIYNHECYTFFLKEELNQSSLGDEFDEFRKIRNSINYYGKEVTTDEASHVIEKIGRFINKIKPFLPISPGEIHELVGV